MAVSESTETVREHERFDYWHDVICRTYVHIDAEKLPSDRTFRAELSAADLGQVTLSRVRAEPHVVHRSGALIDRRPHDTFMVSLMLGGTGILAQDGREAMLRTGDLSLYDGSRPFTLALPERFDMIVLQFERQPLLRRCPVTEQLTAFRMAAKSPAVAPLSAFLRSLEPAALGEGSAIARQLGTSMLDILGVSLAERFGRQPTPVVRRQAYFMRACNYISAQSDDPDLDPSRVASAIGVSVRYLHLLFRDNDTSVTEHIFRRRLARCHDDLVNLAKAHLTITEIGHARGFKTAAHFARRFADAYGATPSSVRRGARSAG